MPQIVGPFSIVGSSAIPIETHAAYLRHLASSKVARMLLQEKYTFTPKEAQKYSADISSFVGQALNFYEDSLDCSRRIRPVLQYYCYLNLAVAVVLAYRPNYYEKYRRHGVVDKSHALNSLNLTSVLVEANVGAVPLFHSILSGVSIRNRKFRLNELFGAIHLVQFELTRLFNISTQQIKVDISTFQERNTTLYHNKVEYIITSPLESEPRISKSRIENAMPDLVQHYKLHDATSNKLVYHSHTGYADENDAIQDHQSKCLRLINFGGHVVLEQGQINRGLVYSWHGISRKALLPTMTATLLLSFALASISRYRSTLLRRIDESEIQVLLDVFMSEADSIVLPTMRNLLFKEEVACDMISV
ncbi:MAG: hypothetical protein F4X08_01225 [Gemmatimonadetes bacterium]|nr:hypothetical protein [Gemmatimonadota bacterium]